MEFARQIRLREVGKAGQKSIRRAHVCVLGAGSLGTWAAMLLGSAGVGKVTLIDRDIVDSTNLAHQPLYSIKDEDAPKASCAAKKLGELFPSTRWIAKDIDLNTATIDSVHADVIIDCTDNLETRYLLNEWCVKNKKPWVHSACIGTSGAVHAFIPAEACFKCLYPRASAIETCETRGILNSAASATASIATSEAIKIIIDEKTTRALIRIDAWKASLMNIMFSKNKKCPVCALKKFEDLGKTPKTLLSFCGGAVFQTYTKPRVKRPTIDGPLLLFPDGRVLVKAPSEQRAKALLSRYLG